MEVLSPALHLARPELNSAQDRDTLVELTTLSPDDFIGAGSLTHQEIDDNSPIDCIPGSGCTPMGVPRTKLLTRGYLVPDRNE
jgi:hypothetical protein